MRKISSFTLIEMLIVIVIIGILAAALVPRLQAVQWRARDSERKVDVWQLHNAISIFKLDNGRYPQPVNLSGTCAYGASCYVYSHNNSSSNRIATLTGIVTSTPTDPLNTIWTPDPSYPWPWYTWNFVYAYGHVHASTSRNSFALFSLLENRKDPDRCEVTALKFYNGSLNTCWSNGACWSTCIYMYGRTDTWE